MGGVPLRVPEKRELVRHWSWKANLRTYEGMLLLLLIVALLSRLR